MIPTRMLVNYGDHSNSPHNFGTWSDSRERERLLPRTDLHFPVFVFLVFCSPSRTTARVVTLRSSRPSLRNTFRLLTGLGTECTDSVFASVPDATVCLTDLSPGSTSLTRGELRGSQHSRRKHTRTHAFTLHQLPRRGLQHDVDILHRPVCIPKFILRPTVLARTRSRPRPRPRLRPRLQARVRE
ncbi:hypothetical protein C8Q80DRAFT_361534 [Daedaleopsis nitida]|nr:hypothetical protein C8Q80DRAFT_361534 [Daedaleopsis nitida]